MIFIIGELYIKGVGVNSVVRDQVLKLEEVVSQKIHILSYIRLIFVFITPDKVRPMENT